MSIIKCPECKRQISDKAPVCPNCGVEIAGKITRCPQCGEIYFKSETDCPNCHNSCGADDRGYVEDRDAPSMDPDVSDNAGASMETVETLNEKHDEDNNNSKKKNKSTLILSIVIAAIVLCIGMYFYYDAKTDKEQDEYEFALKSNDPVILQTYLENFKDAPQEHIDSINACLLRLNKQEDEWANALASRTKSALVDFMDNFPDSRHKQEALNKIDSMDWSQSVRINTISAFQTYMDTHPDGNYYEEALSSIKNLKASEVSVEETDMIRSILNDFFVSINLRDENGLKATVSETINLLGKVGANKNDVVLFMHKLYKDDVKNMVWSLPMSYNIDKKEIGDEKYEYNVSFMATQLVDKIDDSNITNSFKINVKVNPEGKITDFAMTKIING